MWFFSNVHGAGFCMLEAGQVRSKNTAVICLKNIGLFSIAGIMYYLLVIILCMMVLTVVIWVLSHV